MKKYKGIIIKESLKDKNILNELETISVEEEKDMDNPNEIWTLYTLLLTKEEINSIQKHLKKGWYMHFWDDERNVLAVFKNKILEFNYNDRKSWKPVINYGLSLGIPIEQLDFPID